MTFKSRIKNYMQRGARSTPQLVKMLRRSMDPYQKPQIVTRFVLGCRNIYTPHQGIKECARRRRQLRLGQIHNYRDGLHDLGPLHREQFQQ